MLFLSIAGFKSYIYYGILTSKKGNVGQDNFWCLNVYARGRHNYLCRVYLRNDSYVIYSYVIICYEYGKSLLQTTWSRKDVNKAFFRQMK